MRLIDADALKEEICERYLHFSTRLKITGVLEAITKAPSIDAVEVIRCKDCKLKDVEDGFCKGRGWPMQLVPDDGFCDKGERSEE